ncbi:MAG: type II toxin-antitoxin system RelE/ParE family toxin [Candidatus Micrarchaeota archaeon]
MEAIFSDEFSRQKQKIRDSGTLRKLQKAVESILANPEKGKWLSRELAGKKSIRIKPFRLIFEPKENSIIFHTFEHRGKVYR